MITEEPDFNEQNQDMNLKS